MANQDIQIKFFRERAGLTHAELSAMTGIEVYSLICMEKGEVKPTMEDVIKLSHACHVSSDELLGFSPDNMHVDLF